MVKTYPWEKHTHMLSNLCWEEVTDKLIHGYLVRRKLQNGLQSTKDTKTLVEFYFKTIHKYTFTGKRSLQAQDKFKSLIKKGHWYNYKRTAKMTTSPQNTPLLGKGHCMPRTNSNLYYKGITDKLKTRMYGAKNIAKWTTIYKDTRPW